MARKRRLVRLATVGCGVGLLSFAAVAGATYDATSQPGDLIVTVDADGATLANVGSFQIGRKWTVAKDDIVDGKALSADGTLAFADNATILVTGEDKLAVPASREYVIAQAAKVDGAPTLDPASPYFPKWKIETTETEVKLVKADVGLQILIR